MHEKARYINNLRLSGVLLIGANIRKTAYGQRIITNFNLQHCKVASEQEKKDTSTICQWRFVKGDLKRALCCVYIRKTAYGQRIITNFNLQHCIVASDHRISARKRKIHQQSGPQWRFVNTCPTTLKRSK